MWSYSFSSPKWGKTIVASGNFDDDVVDLVVLGVDVEDHAELHDLLHQQLELLDRVLVGSHVVAQLAHPHEAELLAAVLDLLQRLVDELRVDDAGPDEAALVLLDEARDLAVAGHELGGRALLLGALGVDDPALDTGLVEVGHELVEVPGDRVPLPELAALRRAVQVRVEDADRPRRGRGPGRQGRGPAGPKRSQGGDGGAGLPHELATGVVLAHGVLLQGRIATVRRARSQSIVVARPSAVKRISRWPPALGPDVGERASAGGSAAQQGQQEGLVRRERGSHDHARRLAERERLHLGLRDRVAGPGQARPSERRRWSSSTAPPCAASRPSAGPPDLGLRVQVEEPLGLERGLHASRRRPTSS